MKIIDSRVRVPFKSIGDPLLFGSSKSIELAKSFNGYIAESAKQRSVQMLLEEMDDLGIEKAGIITRKSHGMDNNDLIEFVELYGDRFFGIPNIDPLDGALALSEIERLVINGPCKAIIIEAGIECSGVFYEGDPAQCLIETDEVLYPIYESCSQNEIPIIFTCAAIGYPRVDVTVPNRFDQIANDFPKLNILVSHNAWPWTMPMLGVAFKRENVHISPDLYLNVGGWRDLVDCANTILPDQILFGSSYPVTAQKCAVDRHLSVGFNEEVLPKILYENAQKFFKL